MFNDRLLNELIIEQDFVKNIKDLVKKKESLNQLLFLSINQRNDYLNKLILNLIEKDNSLREYFIRENDQYIEKRTLLNLLKQILRNEKFLINQLKRISFQFNLKKKKRNKTFISKDNPQQINSSPFKFNQSNDQTLKIYWRSNSSHHINAKPSSLNMKKISSDTHLNNKFNYSSNNIHCNFTRLARIYPKNNK